MINTYNESTLHRSLKEFFAEKYDGKTEVPLEGSVCDILTKDGTVIEIQTAHLSSLTNKLEKLLPSHRVMLVYPLAVTTIIRTVGTDGKIARNKKSPKKPNIYSIFGELFSAYRLFESKNFSLCVIPITQIKIKQLTEDAVQTAQKSRRFKKNYLITDKLLEQMHTEEIKFFTSHEDFLALLPENIPEIFSSKDLRTTQVKNEANKMLWVLSRMGCIETDHKEGNLIFYRRTK